ncbi:MAG: transposase [Gemmatimonadales bacterium]
MTLGKRRKHREQDLFIASTSMPRSPGHPFYRQLNRLLDDAGFDEKVESLCKPLYVEGRGRPSIPPGVYFRMLLVGYFEGIDSQRGIAWRCADSRSLQEFLGLGPTDRSPDHSSLTRVRKRLPVEIHAEAFALVVRIARDKGLVKGKNLAVDSTTLEANAAMKSIVRRDTGDGWSDYVRGLAKEAGIEDPSDDDLRRFDRKRTGKKVSNKDWQSPSDPDARIAKMKDGRTRMAYKAEHAIDADSEIIVAATIHHADKPDSEIIKDTLMESAGVLALAGAELTYENVIADKGYHKAETLAWLADRGMRTYVSEPKSRYKRKWCGKPTAWRDAYRANRRRAKGARSSSLHRLRSERVERSFAHTCRTGRARRTWIRGVEEVTKRYLLQVAARNLGTIMRALYGVGTPRALQSGARRLLGPLVRLLRALCALLFRLVDLRRPKPAITEDRTGIPSDRRYSWSAG